MRHSIIIHGMNTKTNRWCNTCAPYNHWIVHVVGANLSESHMDGMYVCMHMCVYQSTTRTETTHMVHVSTSSVATVMGVTCCQRHLVINDFSDGDIATSPSRPWGSDSDMSVKLCPRECHRSWATTEMGASCSHPSCRVHSMQDVCSLAWSDPLLHACQLSFILHSSLWLHGVLCLPWLHMLRFARPYIPLICKLLCHKVSWHEFQCYLHARYQKCVQYL